MSVAVSSEDEDSSGYSESVNGELVVTDNVSRSAIDLEVDELVSEAEWLIRRRSILVEKATGTSEKLSRFLSEDGSFSHHSAFMAHIEGESSQVCDNDSIHLHTECEKCIKYAEQVEKFDITYKHNQLLIVDLVKASESNMVLTKNEKKI